MAHYHVRNIQKYYLNKESMNKFFRTDNSGMTIFNTSKTMLNMVIRGNDFAGLILYYCCFRYVLHELVILEHWYTQEHGSKRLVSSVLKEKTFTKKK